MSIANASKQATPPRTADPSIQTGRASQNAACLKDAIQLTHSRTAPLWPLKDYVAINPYGGHADKDFLSARQYLRSLSNVETLMSLDYYQQQYARGALRKCDLDAAVDEMVQEQVLGAENIHIPQLINELTSTGSNIHSADSPFAVAANPQRKIFSFFQGLDQEFDTRWQETVTECISEHCASHYDEGQAIWSSPWREASLFQAWRKASQYDRTLELLGVRHFRQFASKLPDNAFDCLLESLLRLEVPREQWDDYLLCEALSMPGWSAWSRYQDDRETDMADQQGHFVDLMAIRLAYAAALADHYGKPSSWLSSFKTLTNTAEEPTRLSEADCKLYALLKANEIALRSRVIGRLSENAAASVSARPLASAVAQMVFCIDVRSERIRRHLEMMSEGVATYGFAGFFGVPMEFVPFGEKEGHAHVPVLLKPQFRVHERIDSAGIHREARSMRKKGIRRAFRKAWKDFQAAAASTFAFVETTGLFYGFKLAARSLGVGQTWGSRFDGITHGDRKRLSPSLDSLREQGMATGDLVDLAENMLRGMGIVEDFAPLVVLCGHTSRTENNPLQSGLDCGACGGHSGEASARVAAKLFNDKQVREGLASRGIRIPDQTAFVPGVHNTTTDEISFLDLHLLSPHHLDCVEELQRSSVHASTNSRIERSPSLPGADEPDLVRRSRDWSETRPEWGLAGNACFIVGPRSMTRGISLAGRAFLHSYDQRHDPDFAVLEQIMTAPLVVAHLINMQYYASTVDPVHAGSGNKTVHNVVGRFGILSGNGGDLTTGLPWQSIHSGQGFQHHPLRLLAVLAAPRAAIEAILEKHPRVRDLLQNGWLHLISVENDVYYRLTISGEWATTEGSHVGSETRSDSFNAFSL